MRRALLLLALGGCGDEPHDRAAPARVTGDGGPRITLREARLGTYAWTCGRPVSAWLVSGCCAVTTDPRVVGRSPTECAATLTLARCDEPSREVPQGEVLRACGFLRAAPIAVFPRPRVENRGLALSEEHVVRGLTVRVTDGTTSLRGVVTGFTHHQLIVRLVEPAPAADDGATWAVLNANGTLAGVAIAPPSAEAGEVVAYRASAIADDVEACQPVRVPAECDPSASMIVARRRVPLWAAVTASLFVVALFVAALLVRAIRKRRRMKRVRRGGAL